MSPTAGAFRREQFYEVQNASQHHTLEMLKREMWKKNMSKTWRSCQRSSTSGDELSNTNSKNPVLRSILQSHRMTEMEYQSQQWWGMAFLSTCGRARADQRKKDLDEEKELYIEIENCKISIEKYRVEHRILDGILHLLRQLSFHLKTKWDDLGMDKTREDQKYVELITGFDKKQMEEFILSQIKMSPNCERVSNNNNESGCGESDDLGSYQVL